jgi:hypothetical protein
MRHSAAGKGTGSMASRFADLMRIGIALAGLGKFDDTLSDNSVGEIVCKPKGYASHFECDTQNPLGFGIDIEVV